MVTARVGDIPGLKGLGAFLIPRNLDSGERNHFKIRKLKDKFGTRAMATGEIEFDKALAYQVGRVEDGYKIAIGVVLNNSRWINSLGACGIMRRAYIEASTYAQCREAFGKKIAEFPLVKKLLLKIKAEEQVNLCSTFYLTTLMKDLVLHPDQHF